MEVPEPFEHRGFRVRFSGWSDVPDDPTVVMGRWVATKEATIIQIPRRVQRLPVLGDRLNLMARDTEPGRIAIVDEIDKFLDGGGIWEPEASK